MHELDIGCEALMAGAAAHLLGVLGSALLLIFVSKFRI